MTKKIIIFQQKLSMYFFYLRKYFGDYLSILSKDAKSYLL
ncbi:hypothetical protein SAMN05421825_1855 [Epilithonimonas hungarica]|uniref:Uncharacterized protein n=1 Tax=Epilithonimonas hungarica TaxID=454006 RepID=A0A1G7MZY1_9FLAO|nr:hypothetical protein SAMN05421825_1855 [Epilithonimonas hungarica]